MSILMISLGIGLATLASANNRVTLQKCFLNFSPCFKLRVVWVSSLG